MSNQEAIALLRNLEEALDSYCELNEEGKTAFRIAIEALSSSEIPNSSDTISRQAAIDALNNIEIPRNASWYQYYQQALTAVDKLPPAQPERIVRCKDCKHWIPYDWMFSEVWRSRNINDYPKDEIGCNYCDVAMKANDFCSRAERREVTT